MTLAEQLRAEGRIEGRLESEYEIAKRLLSERLELQFIAKITGLPINTIKELQNEVQVFV